MAETKIIKETKHSRTVVHGNKAFPKGNSYIVEPTRTREIEAAGTTKTVPVRTFDILNTTNLEEFKDIFRNAANPGGNTTGLRAKVERVARNCAAFLGLKSQRFPEGIWVLNAMHPNSDEDFSNSSRDNFHIHTFPKGVKETHPHVQDERKSYVPHPKGSDTAKFINTAASSKQAQFYGMHSITLDDGHREAKLHEVLLNPNYQSFADFASGASDDEWRQLQDSMKVSFALGAARFVIRDDLADCFTMEAVGGENLAQPGQVNPKNGNPGRWFDELPTCDAA